MIILAESGAEQCNSGLLDNVSGGAKSGEENSFIEAALNSGTVLLKESGEFLAGTVKGVTGVAGDTLGGLGKVLGGN